MQRTSSPGRAFLGRPALAGYHVALFRYGIAHTVETDSTTPLLTMDHRAMIARGVSVIVSSCGLDLTPSLMRAVGSQISPNGDRITVFLNRLQSAQLLRDVASTGRVAVVFSEPHSHRTVQVKSSQARLREVTRDDVPVLQRYLLAMQGELGRVGVTPDLVAAMLAYRFEDLSAIEFTPSQAFDQTPGPHAGRPLQAAP